MTLSMDAVVALAPDDASARAARGLLGPSQWPLLGASSEAVWGECQGSGSKPYQAQVDLAGPAFRCSCPSRKFPCKHGLALLMLLAQDPARFASTAPPARVTEWLASRADAAQKKEHRQEQPAAPADAKAAAQREDQRWQRIADAAQELQRWLHDQVARGLGSLDDAVLATWQTMAARMVDAQAPGLGLRVREAAAGIRQGADWPERTLRRFGLLHLLCDALQRRASLDAGLQADLRTAAGWPHDRADVVAHGAVVADCWTVIGSATEEREDKLVERRVWLQGKRHHRRAWLLDHSFGGRGFEQAWHVGSGIETSLAFYPGASALRAMPLEPAGPPGPPTWPSSDSPSEWDAVARRVASCPWARLHPLLLTDAVPVRKGEQMLAVVDHRAVPLQLEGSDAWTLLAVSGGRPCQLMGEWDGAALSPLAAWLGQGGAPVWQRGAA